MLHEVAIRFDRVLKNYRDDFPLEPRPIIQTDSRFWSNHLFVIEFRGFLSQRGFLKSIELFDLKAVNFLLLSWLSPEAPHSRACFPFFVNSALPFFFF